MHGFVSQLAKDMERVCHLVVQQAFSAKRLNAPGGVVPVSKGQGDVVEAKHEIDDGLAHHAELDEAGVGVARPVFFRQPAELGQFGEFFFQKGKVRSHGRLRREYVRRLWMGGMSIDCIIRKEKLRRISFFGCCLSAGARGPVAARNFSEAFGAGLICNKKTSSS